MRSTESGVGAIYAPTLLRAACTSCSINQLFEKKKKTKKPPLPALSPSLGPVLTQTLKFAAFSENHARRIMPAATVQAGTLFLPYFDGQPEY